MSRKVNTVLRNINEDKLENVISLRNFISNFMHKSVTLTSIKSLTINQSATENVAVTSVENAP